MNILKDSFSISDETVELMQKAEKDISPLFEQLEENAAYNQAKVLAAFRKYQVSDAHLSMTTGYGYDDLGRDTLDKIYAEVFGSQAAIVRHSIVSGTHALSSCFFGVLRPGDKLLSVTGRPYDTLEEVIGLRGERGNGSLFDFGISYDEVQLKTDGTTDLEAIKKAAGDGSVKMVAIQRSKGYAWRKSLYIEDIKQIIDTVKSVNKDIVCMVDNCYGEFVEKTEPTQVGADIIAGSLIKNPGGGLSLTGGYIAGRADLIEKISYRLTSPGIGGEVGASLGMNRGMYQGFFMAPHVVCESLKTAILAARMLELKGYDVCPASDEKRGDIIQSVKLLSADKVCRFCQGIQMGAPIDSFVKPEPWDMPGYEDKVIMAAGAFVSGSSIEISADAPIRPPYIAYLQGGLTYQSGKIAVMCALEGIK